MPQLTNHTVSPGLEQFWKRPEMMGLPLLTMLLDSYGPECVSWSPETIELEIKDDFGVEVPEASLDRLLTAILLFTTDVFFHSLPDFIRACVSLSGTFVAENTMVMPDSEDIAWGITEALLINPPEEKNENPFSQEITAFIGEVLDEEGILTPPDVLRIATRNNQLLDRVSYDFSDDPEMFSAIQQVESERTQAINQAIKTRMRTMLMQLHQLPLKHGKTGFVANLISKF